MQIQFPHKRIIELIVSFALFMDALDATIINTAIPAISRSLKVNPIDLKIALISYLLTLAIFIPISGFIADRFGLKRVFIAALAIFTISSFWCGYAQNLVQLVIARSAQGLGGAFMLPVGRLIILRTFARHELVNAMNHVIMVVSIGLMLGPLAGGFITDRFSWHWIFWVNIPIGIFAILLSFYFLKESVSKTVEKFDFIGFILFGGGLALLTFSLSNLSQSSANKEKEIYILLIAALLLILYFYHAKTTKRSIINLTLFRWRTFRVSVIGNLLCRLGFGGVTFLLPLLLQIGLHYSAELSGLLLVPIAIGVLFVKVISLRVLRFFGYRNLLLNNTFLIALSLWTFMFIQQSTSIIVIACCTFLFGILISIQYSGMNSLAYADIQTHEHSAAISIMSTMQQLAQSFGVAVSALFLRIFSTVEPSKMLSPHVFHLTFFALGCLTLLAIFIFKNLQQKDGINMLNAPAQEKVEL